MKADLIPIELDQLKLRRPNYPDNCLILDIADNVRDKVTTNFRCFVIVISSEGALYVILPYDYPARSTHFLNTHRSLITTLSINAMMTLVTVITMMTKTTKMTIFHDNF